MKDFEPADYEATRNLFETARKIRESLPSLVDQIADTVDMLGTAQLGALPKGSPSGNPMERRILERVELVRRMEDKRDEYRAVLHDAERVIENMELHGEGDPGEGAFLRRRYLQGMGVRDAAEACGYSRTYGYEKLHVALVHASEAAKRLGLV